MSVSAEEFKAGMGLRAGAVGIITARAGDEVQGMTATDWVGVSVDPPLVLVCAEKSANTLGVIQKGGCFSINVLCAGQDALSNKFASKKEEATRFVGLVTETGKTGAPLLSQAMASFDCVVEMQHDAGDHIIVVGRVEQIVHRGGEPLVYYSGGYRGLSSGS